MILTLSSLIVITLQSRDMSSHSLTLASSCYVRFALTIIKALLSGYIYIYYNYINLFKAYCCSFYGLQVWQFNSSEFDKSYKSWNIVVRLILGSPYNTHTYLLCPLMGQTGIREQLYIRSFRFL